MKILYVIRHAKSSWTFNVNDHDRPLGKRGRKDVIKIGKVLKNNVKPPGLMITSTASRALNTCLFLADALGVEESSITLDHELYHAGPIEMIHAIKRCPDIETLAIVGHNPGLTNFINAYTEDWIDNLPTCGVMGIKFKIDSWKQLDSSKGKQIFYYFPKGIDK